jgi:mono/diheme cytochrome c family protein
MPPAEREALAAYLETFEGDGTVLRLSRDADVDPVFELTGDRERGVRVWMAACATCHGDAAEGGLGPALTGDAAVDAFTFAEYVRSGALHDADGFMPWFRQDRLSDQELADLCAAFAE